MKTPNTSPQAIELNPVQDVLGNPISKGLVLALGKKHEEWMCFWSPPCSVFYSSTEPRECLAQIGHLIVSAQQARMSVQTSVSPGTHLVAQIVDRVKYGLGPGCHTSPRKVSLPSGEA